MAPLGGAGESLNIAQQEGQTIRSVRHGWSTECDPTKRTISLASRATR